METKTTLTLEQVSNDLSYYRSVGVLSDKELLEITHNLIDKIIADSAMATE